MRISIPKNGRALYEPAIFLFLILFLSACLAPKEERPVYSREIAHVGDMKIKEDLLRFRFKLELDKLPPDYVEKYRDKPLNEDNQLKPVLERVLQKMIEDNMILSYGKKHNVMISEEELQERFVKRKNQIPQKELESLLRQLEMPYSRWKDLIQDQIRVQYILEKMLENKINISLSEVRHEYQRNRHQYKVDEQVRIRHIVTDSKEKAEELLERLRNGENFAKLAVSHSLSPDRAQGGEMDYYAKGDLPDVFDHAFALEKGQISDIYVSKYGYHIFKLLDKKPSRTKTLEEVAGQIHQELYQKKLEKNYQDWIEKVRKEIPVKIFKENLREFIL